MLSQHEQGIARIDHAVDVAVRDRKYKRDCWRRVFVEQKDTVLRSIIAELAKDELSQFVDRIDTLTQLRELVEAHPPVERRSPLMVERREAPLGVQESSIDDELTNRDFIRENHVLAFNGGLVDKSWPVVHKYRQRTFTVGGQRRSIWNDDDRLTFNSAGTMRYEDAFDDDGSSDREERIAMRVEAGISPRYARITELTEDGLEDQEIFGPDGQVDVHEEIPVDDRNEVVTQEEDGERPDYAPSIIRKQRTHVVPSDATPVVRRDVLVGDEIVSKLVAAGGHRELLHADPLSNLAEREIVEAAAARWQGWFELAYEEQAYSFIEAFEDQGIVVYDLVPDLLTLSPSEGEHPGQRTPRVLVTGKALDGTTPFVTPAPGEYDAKTWAEPVVNTWRLASIVVPSIEDVRVSRDLPEAMLLSLPPRIEFVPGHGRISVRP